jgi:hypothetical protein
MSALGFCFVMKQELGDGKFWSSGDGSLVSVRAGSWWRCDAGSGGGEPGFVGASGASVVGADGLHGDGGFAFEVAGGQSGDGSGLERSGFIIDNKAVL